MWNWFNQAGQIKDLKREVDFLTRQLQFTEDRATHAERKVELLDKSVVGERNKHDKFVAVAMDKLTKNAGTFQKSLLPVEPLKEREIDPREMSKLEATAKLNQESDIAMGYDPWPLEEYIDRIKNDPQKYLPQ